MYQSTERRSRSGVHRRYGLAIGLVLVLVPRSVGYAQLRTPSATEQKEIVDKIAEGQTVRKEWVKKNDELYGEMKRAGERHDAARLEQLRKELDQRTKDITVLEERLRRLRSEALDLTAKYYGLNGPGAAAVSYDPYAANFGRTSPDGKTVRIGDPAFGTDKWPPSPAWLASTVLHEQTHAAQLQHDAYYRAAVSTDKPTDDQQLINSIYEYRAYQAELDQAKSTGLSEAEIRRLQGYQRPFHDGTIEAGNTWGGRTITLVNAAGKPLEIRASDAQGALKFHQVTTYYVNGQIASNEETKYWSDGLDRVKNQFDEQGRQTSHYDEHLGADGKRTTGLWTATKYKDAKDDTGTTLKADRWNKEGEEWKPLPFMTNDASLGVPLDSVANRWVDLNARADGVAQQILAGGAPLQPLAPLITSLQAGIANRSTSSSQAAVNGLSSAMTANLSAAAIPSILPDLQVIKLDLFKVEAPPPVWLRDVDQSVYAAAVQSSRTFGPAGLLFKGGLENLLHGLNAGAPVRMHESLNGLLATYTSTLFSDPEAGQLALQFKSIKRALFRSEENSLPPEWREIAQTSHDFMVNVAASYSDGRVVMESGVEELEQALKAGSFVQVHSALNGLMSTYTSLLFGDVEMSAIAAPLRAIKTMVYRLEEQNLPVDQQGIAKTIHDVLVSIAASYSPGRVFLESDVDILEQAVRNGAIGDMRRGVTGLVSTINQFLIDQPEMVALLGPLHAIQSQILPQFTFTLPGAGGSSIGTGGPSIFPPPGVNGFLFAPPGGQYVDLSNVFGAGPTDQSSQDIMAEFVQVALGSGATPGDASLRSPIHLRPWTVVSVSRPFTHSLYEPRLRGSARSNRTIVASRAVSMLPQSQGRDHVRTEASLVATGASTGEVFQLQILNSEPAGQLAVTDGLVLEPIKRGATEPVAARARGAALTTSPVIGYCLDFIKEPPPPGQLYRVAGAAMQEKFKPLRYVLQAGRKLQAAGLLHPDSDPKGYVDSIKQWATWAQIENWDLKAFGEHFVERTKKNVEAMKRNWTKEMESAIRGVIPGRWKDITAVSDEARRLMQADRQP